MSVLVLLLTTTLTQAQKEVSVLSDGYELFGTLLEPANKTTKAVLIIAGSGPTDRDGNTQPSHINDGLKKLAEELTQQGYATLRYDKRGVGKSLSEAYSIKTLRFEHLALDAEKWIEFLKGTYADITVIGHSQGAIVGLMATSKIRVNRFISLAGMSEDAYNTVKRQLEGQTKVVTDFAFPILDSLRQGIKVQEVPPFLYVLFAPDQQDFFISFIRHDPRQYMKELRVPSLVIAGTKDLQITVEGSKALASASNFSQIQILDEMNHILRRIPGDMTENIDSYNKATLPLHESLVPTIQKFIESPQWYTPYLALLGTWKIGQKEQYESWEFDAENESFIGQGYTLSQGNKHIQETLRIERKDDKVIYTATVIGQNNGQGIKFTEATSSLNGFTFKNPNHDYPKKIEYQLESSKLKAIVTGDNGKGFEMEMTKQE